MLDRPTAARGLHGYLLLTALLGGAVVMIIEVLGSRVLGPFFGVSLFVWTSLITVTLLALALGYLGGGILADSRGSAAELYLIIFLAGLWLLLIPYLKSPVLMFCMPLGLRAGAFSAALILFGLPLLLLGCIMPYLVRLLGPTLPSIGRTVGALYALSTLGSVAGTLLSGFFLIGHFGINQIFTLSGSTLLLLAAGYAALFSRGHRLAGSASVLLLPLLLPVLLSRQETSVLSTLQNDDTRITMVANEESFYGNLKVIDYYGPSQHTRELLIDGLSQGRIDLFNNLSVYDYSYFLTLIPFSLNPDGRRCLVLGLGPGIIPRWFAARGIETQVLDINPAVAFLAQDYFAFGEEDGEIIIADPRYFLKTTELNYDYIILDVFGGDTTPAYLLSLEALRLMRTRMHVDGVLALNLIASLRRDNRMSASVVHTLQQVFDQVDIYPTFHPDNGAGIGNLALIAYDGAPRPFDPAILNRFPLHEEIRQQLYNTLGRGLRFEFEAGTGAIVLSDDYNPIDVYDAWLKEKVRQAILSTIDWEILTGPN